MNQITLRQKPDISSIKNYISTMCSVPKDEQVRQISSPLFVGETSEVTMLDVPLPDDEH